MDSSPSKSIRDHEINPGLTEKYRKDPNFQKYIEWGKANGVKMSKITLLHLAQMAGLVAASEDIPPNTAFAAVPHRLLISPTKVRKSEIGEMINKHPELFLEHIDAHFNVLTAFLIFEKLKGEKSFYAPYINLLTSNEVTAMTWKEDEIKETNDIGLRHELRLYADQYEEDWLAMKAVFDEYPALFPAKYSREDFLWAYENVVTRCYGAHMPETVLVPFGDIFNHSDEGVLEYVVNTKFEIQGKPSSAKYFLKQKRVDLSIFNINSQKSRSKTLDSYDKKTNYVKTRKQFLSKESQERFESGEKLLLEELKKLVHEINLNMMTKNDKIQIWNVDFVESTDDEDNDSDDERDEEGEGDVFKQIHSREVAKLQSKEVPSPEEKEVEEKKSEEKDVNSTENKSPFVTNGGETTAIKIQEANVKQETTPQSADSDIDSDEEEWTWFDENDPDNYFVSCTRSNMWYKKGEQVYVRYGKRSNKFLLTWYGFASLKNKFNSFSFRLHMDPNFSSRVNPKAMIVTEEDDEVSLRDLSKEFRLKESRLCEDLLSFLRIKNLMNYKDFSAEIVSNTQVSFPSSVKFEKEIINLAIEILSELKNQFKTTISEDEKILQSKDLPLRKRFAVNYRLCNKRILDEQMKLLNTISTILAKVEEGIPYRVAYFSKLIPEETDLSQVLQNRKKIRNYLKFLNIGIRSKSK